MKTRVFLVHGFRGTPSIPAWYPWLKSELKKKSVKVFSPQFPTPSKPKRKTWTKVFEKELGGNFENVIFIGHSLGGLAILRAIEAHKTDEKVSAVIMVGTPIAFCGRSEIHEFLPPPGRVATRLSNLMPRRMSGQPLDWKKLRRRVGRFIHIVSLDDPFVPYRHGIEFKKKLGGRLIKYKKKRHFQEQKKFDGIIRFFQLH